MTTSTLFDTTNKNQPRLFDNIGFVTFIDPPPIVALLTSEGRYHILSKYINPLNSLLLFRYGTFRIYTYIQ